MSKYRWGNVLRHRRFSTNFLARTMLSRAHNAQMRRPLLNRAGWSSPFRVDLLLRLFMASLLAAALAPAGASAASAASASGANLLQNGCLTDPQLAVPQIASPTLGPGRSAQLPGWVISTQVVVGDTADQTSGPGCPDYVYLESDGSISQVVQTTPGFDYLVQWEFNAHHWGPGGPRQMKVFWEGRLVAAPSFNYVSNTQPWAHEQVMVTATERQSSLTLQDANDGSGEVVSNVSVTPASEVVNGFTVTNSSGAYATALRQVLAKLPGSVFVPGPDKPVASLRAASAAQVRGGAGVLIVWAVEPTAGFIHEPLVAQRASARTVEEYLVGLLGRSRSLYLSSLRASRLPPQGGKWWGVEAQSLSTAGSPMSFEVVSAGAGITMTWANIPEVRSVAPALANEAVANMLYYSKEVLNG
jgi:hypothetical protein